MFGGMIWEMFLEYWDVWRDDLGDVPGAMGCLEGRSGRCSWNSGMLGGMIWEMFLEQWDAWRDDLGDVPGAVGSLEG